MFRRAVHLAADGAGRVGGMPTTPVASAHREQRDRRVCLVTAACARRALASLQLQGTMAATAAAITAATTATEAEHAHELLAEVAAAETVDEEVDSRVQAHHHVADVRQVYPLDVQVAEMGEGHL